MAADSLSWTADPNAARQLRTVRDAVRLLAILDSPAEVFHDVGDSRHNFTVALKTAFLCKDGKYRTAEEVGRMLLDIPAHGGGYGHQKGEPSHYYAFGPLLSTSGYNLIGNGDVVSPEDAAAKLAVLRALNPNVLGISIHDSESLDCVRKILNEIKSRK